MIDRALAWALRRNVPGAFRLARALRGDYPLPLVRVRSVHGLDWTVDPGNFIDAAVLRRGFYEAEVLDAALDVLGDGVFWDIGANVGLIAVTAKRLRPRATVVAFEPVPYLASRLMLHARMNEAEVTVAPFALGETAGYAPLSVKLSGNSGLSSLRPWPGVGYEAEIQARVERADALIGAGVLPAPDVIKLDVEGFELEALRGFGERLAEVKAIIFESDGAQYEEIVRLLAREVVEVSPKNYLALAARAEG